MSLLDNTVLIEKAQEILQALKAARTVAAQPAVDKRLFSVDETARYIGRTAKAVRYLIAAKKIPVVKAGGRVMLDKHDLDTWIENSKKGE